MELWPGGPLQLPHEFAVDEVRLFLPPIPAHRLLGWLALGAWWELFPGAVEPEQLTPLNLRYCNDYDDLDLDHFHDVATTIFGRLTGFAAIDGGANGWWQGRQLAATILADWPVYSAWCAAHGTTPLREHLHEVLATAYAWLRERAGPEGWDQLDQRLFAPPPNARTTSGDHIPRSVRDAEAALALATLNEARPGEIIAEWSDSTPR